MRDKVVDKLLSGKFWLTMMSGMAFVYAVTTKILPEEAVAAIITMVFMSYFNKNNGSKPTT